MTSCTFCRKENARLRCSTCKATFYCDKKCQKRGWSVHKQFCSDDPAMRPIIAVEHDVERLIAAARKYQVEPPPDVHCFICLEGGDGLLSQGCGCRGTSGFAHPECLEKMAASQTGLGETFKRHGVCGTCEQQFISVSKSKSRESGQNE